jgi:hypothetical protein
MKILVGCEESQAVTIEFRKFGHEAFSCDLKDCSGGHPEWHLQMDVFKAIDLKEWDMGIFFPDCTHLTVSGNKWFKPEFRDRFPNKPKQREQAILFVKKLWNCGIPKISIENPIGVLSTRWMKPTQIIQPYYFGNPHPKSTCLWLKNLPKLFHAKETDLFNDKVTHVVPQYIIGKRDGKKYSMIHYKSVGKGDRAKIRSKTFNGIAKAMAEQWT